MCLAACQQGHGRWSFDVEQSRLPCKHFVCQMPRKQCSVSAPFAGVHSALEPLAQAHHMLSPFSNAHPAHHLHLHARGQPGYATPPAPAHSQPPFPSQRAHQPMHGFATPPQTHYDRFVSAGPRTPHTPTWHDSHHHQHPPTHLPAASSLASPARDIDWHLAAFDMQAALQHQQHPHEGHALTQPRHASSTPWQALSPVHTRPWSSPRTPQQSPANPIIPAWNTHHPSSRLQFDSHTTQSGQPVTWHAREAHSDPRHQQQRKGPQQSSQWDTADRQGAAAVKPATSRRGRKKAAAAVEEVSGWEDGSADAAGNRMKLDSVLNSLRR